jgi:predicted  nucleic acid-binding Zn-ribbon protein
MIGLKQKFESRIKSVKENYENRIADLEKQISLLEKLMAVEKEKAAKKYEDLLDRNIALEHELEDLEEAINKETI